MEKPGSFTYHRSATAVSHPVISTKWRPCITLAITTKSPSVKMTCKALGSKESAPSNFPIHWMWPGLSGGRAYSINQRLNVHWVSTYNRVLAIIQCPTKRQHTSSSKSSELSYPLCSCSHLFKEPGFAREPLIVIPLPAKDMEIEDIKQPTSQIVSWTMTSFPHFGSHCL